MFQNWRWVIDIDYDVFRDYERLTGDIETCARERWFLLNLKAKFAGTIQFHLSDGQYMSSRLSRSINCLEVSTRKHLILSLVEGTSHG